MLELPDECDECGSEAIIGDPASYWCDDCGTEWVVVG